MTAKKPKRTHCRRGHEYTDLDWHSGTKHRLCRVCRSDMWRARYQEDEQFRLNNNARSAAYRARVKEGKMPTVLEVRGADLSDTSFTLGVPHFPAVTWNVTRIQRDADAGKFGKPVRILREEMPALGPNEQANIDWPKVSAIVNKWAANPEDPEIYKPVLSVLFVIGDGVVTRVPVDGNHRILARFLMGADSYESFVVPHQIEADYRIRFFENGVEVDAKA